MRRTLPRLKRAAVAGALALAATAGGAAVTGSPAQAAVRPWVWDDVRGCAQMFAVPDQTTYQRACPRNGSKFDMRCWLDNQGYRWFWGQEYDTGRWGYIRALWVYDQVWTPHC